MEENLKQLLLKDLSARLPYYCRVFYEYVDDLDNKTYGYSLILNTWCIDEFVANKAVVKPYLRPISSMTKEEKKECNKLRFAGGMAVNVADYCDWLNAHHFDYRGLIEKGLAIAVTEENNPYKEK